MCCFSGNVTSVSDTNLFARSAVGDRQFLVYSMQYEADSELAMILPLPVPPAAPEDALQFIDLSGYPAFFADLRLGFPEPIPRGAPLQRLGAPQAKALRVYDVGSFEASFVPQPADFERLDGRFRLPAGVWDQLPQYRDWGFAVFKLKSGVRTVHPMAFEFPRRDDRRLFFPTVHIHHGKVESDAEFDHTLYCQTTPGLSKEWEESLTESGRRAAQHFMAIEKTQGIVEPVRPVYRQRLHGSRKNEDIEILI